MSRQLFDTNILIDHLNGLTRATSEFEAGEAPAISIISWMEVMAGAATAQEETTLRAFLAHFHVLPVDEAVAVRAVAVRRSMRIKLPDAIILATAQENARLLCTRNVKDFPAGTPGVRVPYQV